MIQKVTITSVGLRDKKKDGTPYTTKAGKPFFYGYIKTKETADAYVNGSVFNGEEKTWKEGVVVELDITEEEYQGKMSKKFYVPNQQAKVTAKVADMAKEFNTIGFKLGVFEGYLIKICEALKIPTKPNPYDGLSKPLQEQIKKDEIDASEIPF